MGRSELLKKFTATFLEPDHLKRVQIKNALQNIWIKKGVKKIPLSVQKASEVALAKKGILNIPVITQNTLNKLTFHYQMTDQVDEKSISTFNDKFSVAEEYEDYTMFQL